MHEPDFKSRGFEKYLELLPVVEKSVLAFHPHVHVERFTGRSGAELSFAPSEMTAIASEVNAIHDRSKIRGHDAHHTARLENAKCLPRQDAAGRLIQMLEQIFAVNPCDSL